MPTENTRVFVTPLEENDANNMTVVAGPFLQLGAFPVYIPENKLGIPEGDYSRNEFVRLMRESSHNPDTIYFLADMLEG